MAVSWGGRQKGKEDSFLRLTLIADHYPGVEIWDTQRNAVDLMERAFGRRVLLDSTAAPEVFSG